MQFNAKKKNHELCKNVVHALHQENNFNLKYSVDVFVKIYLEIINLELYNPNWAAGSSSEPLYTMLPEREELLETSLLLFNSDKINWQILQNGTDATLSFIFKYMNTTDDKLKKYYLEIIKRLLASKWNKESSIRFHDEQQNYHYEVDRIREKVEKIFNKKLTDFLYY